MIGKLSASTHERHNINKLDFQTLLLEKTGFLGDPDGRA
jgi:hypothetical protein